VHYNAAGFSFVPLHVSCDQAALVERAARGRLRPTARADAQQPGTETIMNKVATCMKRNVITLPETATLGEAAARFADEHVGTLPIVDAGGHLVGLLHLHDLLGLIMPDFITLIENFDFVRDFGVLEDKAPESQALAQQVTRVMHRPIAVSESAGLLRAFALIDQHDLYDLPIVDKEYRLVGLASRVDVGTALLATWRLSSAAP
jgi:CBS domain-containing protein